MATIYVDSTTQLLSSSSIEFIRQIDLRVNATLLKPFTRMYPFFDGIDVGRFFQQINTPTGLGNYGDALYADSDGKIDAWFSVPGMTFTTGKKILELRQYYSGVGGSTVTATFQSSGEDEQYLTTITNTDNRVFETITYEVAPAPTPPVRIDPLAQSFFTYGMSGGIFITSIDLYFRTKDETLPIWVEIREMNNGYPTDILVADTARAILSPSSVNLSSTASVPTNFKFDNIVYLQENKDYCFVIMTRSKEYTVFTSQLGDKSIETGKIVWDQPYSGSIFRSENNLTWTAEQFNDVKFTMYKAEFNINVGANLVLPMSANQVTINSSALSTVIDTGYIYIEFPHKHGLIVGSKVGLYAPTGAGTYNGILGTALRGDFSVFSVVSEFAVGIVIPGVTATSTGRIFTGGVITDIQVDNSGINYSTSDIPTVTITGTGTGATAIAQIMDGGVFDVVVTNGGTGYTTPPTVTINSTLGTGATATAINETRFLVYSNRIYHSINPSFTTLTPQNTSIGATLETTLGDFPSGPSGIQYTTGKVYPIDINKFNVFDNNLLLVSRPDEIANMSNSSSSILNIELTSTNKNLSPVIDLNTSRMYFNGNSINNQDGVNEVITSTNSSSSLTSVSVIDGGIGYDASVTVNIVGTGTGATATATTVSDGAGKYKIDTVTVTNGGTGYFGPPDIYFVCASTPSTRAITTKVMTNYNSEKTNNLGSALARYITKKQNLDTISSGIRVFATAYSNIDSSFEVYIQTSASNSEWILLNCDVTRNKSSEIGQFKEYEFYLDKISEFNTYSLKFVLRTLTPWDCPIISDYRAIILAA